jgi:hypothetical protein
MAHPDRPPTCVQGPFDETFRIRPDKPYLVHNRTPRPICVAGGDHGEHGEFVLSPLAQRVVKGARLAPFEDQLRLLRQRHQLRVREVRKESPPGVLGPVTVVLLLVLATATLAYDGIVLGTLVRWEAAVALTGIIALVVVLVGRAGHRERARVRCEQAADTDEGDIEFGVGGSYYDGNDSVRRTKQALTLVAIVAIGAVLPAIAIFVATDAKEFLLFDGGLRVKDGLESRLVSRLIQVIYTAVLALFPALMYFQFDQQRVGTIRGKWVRAIFRMDPRMTTLADIDARYGDDLAEASSYSTDSIRLLGGRHSPIVVATILISLGWTVLVMQTESFDFAGAAEVSALAADADQAADRASDVAAGRNGDDLASRAAAAEDAADEAASASAAAAEVAARSTGDTIGATPTTVAPAAEPTEQSIDADAAAAEAAANAAADDKAAVVQPFFQLLVPTPSAATMAFLGAYFFAVYLVLRGYFSGYLRPKLYNQITARLVTVVVLAYLVNVLYTGDDRNRFLWAVAFLAGVVPTTVLQRIGLAGSSFLGRHTGNADRGLRAEFAKAFATPRSLTQVDGIDMYDSARLESEGITNIPSLAKSDLVSMMVNTQLPVDQLVDWTDQAMLILVVDAGGDEGPSERLKALRRVGIRTASNLVDVAGEPAGSGRRVKAEEALDGGGSGACLLAGLARQIEREPSIRRVRYWYGTARAELSEPCPVLGSDGQARENAVTPNGDRPTARRRSRWLTYRISGSQSAR